MKKRDIIKVLLILLFVFIDQLSKYFVLKYLSIKTLTIIPKVIDFTLVKNTGGAFGVFSGSTYIIALITIVLIYFLIKFMFEEKNKHISISYLLILSGAIGNLIDRVSKNYVVDFISTFNGRFPVFNFADILITCGVALFLFYIVKEEKDERNKCIKRKRK